MLTKFKAQNYGCLKNVEVDLAPVHAFIGPNDSGKSTILHAVRTLGQFAAGKFDAHPSLKWTPFDPRFGENRGTTSALHGFGPNGWYSIAAEPSGQTLHEEFVVLPSAQVHTSTSRAWNQRSALADASVPENLAVAAALGPARLLRLDPDALRQPSGLIPYAEAVDFLDDRGAGLPGVLQAIQGRGDDSFQQLSARVRQVFPTVKRVGVRPITRDRLTLETELTDGTVTTAAQMSEGLLYFLAFAALPWMAPTSILLVEEPENGLHPARVADIVHALRAHSLATNTQVLISTHSPLVIDELTADEVTVLTRPSVETGTKAIPIKATHNFAERAGVYSLGELWLSYSDGDQEEPLFNPRLR